MSIIHVSVSNGINKLEYSRDLNFSDLLLHFSIRNCYFYFTNIYITIFQMKRIFIVSRYSIQKISPLMGFSVVCQRVHSIENVKCFRPQPFHQTALTAFVCLGADPDGGIKSSMRTCSFVSNVMVVYL